MKKIVIVALCCSAFFVSCKQTRKDMLVGKWQAVKYENPELDQFFEETGRYIDTIGNNGDPATNIQLYGSANIDSVRKILRLNRDSTMTEQLNTVKKTSFNFMPSNILVIDFAGRSDTGKWSFAKDNEARLQVEETTGPDKGNTIQIDIEELKTDTLILKILQDTTYSKVTFIKSRN